MVELVWDGKYDSNGKRTAPLRLKLPFQTVETVNESVQQRQMALDLFSLGKQNDWRNRLIWGDKKYVLPALLDEFAGKVDLIYIDPPFKVGSDFSFTATIPDLPETDINEEATFLKEPSIIEQKAYRDTWGQGLDSYLKWFYETVVILRELLSEKGSLFVHLDWHSGHYAKSVLDEIFGQSNLLNEIVWYYVNKLPTGGDIFDRHHDLIFWYGKSSNHTFNEIRVESEYKGTQLQTKKIDGKRVPVVDPITGKQVRVMSTDKPCGDVWRINMVHAQVAERTGYPTQKPEELLERIIKSASNEDDLVLDCFCGSGTTAAVAEKMGRRWITCDLGRFAIHTARKRLLSIPGVKPFEVQNLGKYERQAWQTAEFGGEKEAAAVVAQYRRFILDLYHARPVTGYAWLHGLRDGRMVHIGAVDSPISPNDVKQIAIEFHKATGTGKDAPSVAAVDVLGWDFAFELNEVAKLQASEAGINMRFIRIPREILEQKAVEQGDIRFFELAALGTSVSSKGKEVNLELTDFTIPPDDVPDEIQKAISHFSQWIDYWAVDWENKGDTFHNMWQAYRTRQSKTLNLKASHIYDEPGEYTVMVKAIDILGNDTTKVLKITVV